ncbi:hypothetical protein PRIPAC_88447 [Pristionchus pacificus]|uniref:ABC transporter ATP-binding protein n=1 Tax=Pristionchus pacificus TaxID=54126 RepID=A0A2A6B7L1_PRIPA|nr:hypothetical protein PRIPAC_88447 [Pristionchus pacificus]|eukprot:PDM61843.1 ABC transporter ATP-binding protein [Pristionchus pacificus]
MPSKKVSPLENRLDGDAWRGKTIDPNDSSDDVMDHEDDEPYVHTISTAEKVTNLLLCRGDLNSQEITIKPVTLWGLMRFGSPYDKLCFLLGCLCAILSGISQPCLAIIGGRLANTMLVYAPHSEEFRTAAYENVYIFIGMSAAVVIIHLVQYFCFHGVCTRIILRLRREFMRALLRQNAGWFDRQHSGDLVSKLNDNMERIHEGIGDKLGLLIRGFSMLIAAIIIAFIYEWRLALMMLGVAPLSCFTMALMARKTEGVAGRQMASIGAAGSVAEEAILGVRTVQSLNGQPEMVKRYAEKLTDSKGFAMWNGFWNGFFGGFFYFILYTYMGCGMLYGGYLLSVDVVKDPGTVFIVIMAMMLGAYFLGMISPHLLVLLNARAAAAHIYQIIDRMPKIDVYAEGGTKPSGMKGRVVLENVHFRYPSRKETKVLFGLNLTVEPGQTVALVGHSGCGKSTSIGLVTRLYMPERGRVLIDGHDVNTMNLEYLRNIVGVVQQEPVLFNATIADNLRLGKPDITRDEMVDVCQKANAHDFIVKLPQGYDTLIGDGGVQLSGGQKQRVAIARTLARDPKVLLLDEATSALDAQSEGIVQEALNKASKGRATIVIAHRLSTIKDADKIVYIDKVDYILKPHGQVAEMGTHEELVRLGGKYYELVKAQQFNKEEDDSTGSDVVEEDVPLDCEVLELVTAQQFNKEDDSTGSEDIEDDVSLDDEFPEESPRAMSTYSRDSIRSGTEAFRRGAVDSMRASISSRIAAEEAVMAEEAEKLIKHDEITRGGLGTALKHAKGNYHWIGATVVAACIRGVDLPAFALLVGYVFQAFQERPYSNGQMMHTILMALICFIAVGVGSLICQVVSSSLTAAVAENLLLKFRIMSFRSILYQDAAYFDNPSHTGGKLITRLATDAPNMQAAFDARMMSVVYAASAMLMSIAIALGFCWPVGLLGILCVICLLTMMFFLAYRIYELNILMVKEDEAGRRAIETIENVRTIQLLTREKKFFELYYKELRQQQGREFSKGFYEALNFTFTQSDMFLIFTVCFALGIHVMYIGLMSADRTFIAINAMMIACEALIQAAPFFPEMVKAKTAAGLVFAVALREPTTGDSSKGQHVGTTVALVGPSGSGKSTLISMLERFYDPSSGFLVAYMTIIYIFFAKLLSTLYLYQLFILFQIN